MDKRDAVFCLLSGTWGLPMTLAGLLTALVLALAGQRPQRHGPCLHFRVGKGWGGVSLGPVILTAGDMPRSLWDHEVGHSLQNCLYGPAMPLLVSLPSAARYWLRRRRPSRREYDAVWFERQATRWGNAYMHPAVKK